MIEGGYYIKARKIQDSEIAFAPPHVREIWDWLIKEANHSDDGKFKRGQVFKSLRDIQNGLKWYVGYRKEMYSKSKCEMAMNWLRKRGMITTTKTTRGMFITVCNYDTYQDPKNYEKNNERTTKATRKEQQSDTINKNVKKVKNENKYKEFADSVLKFNKKYQVDMLGDFVRYWGEFNPAKTRMRWEMEKTWSLAGRLTTWNKRNQERAGPAYDRIRTEGVPEGFGEVSQSAMTKQQWNEHKKKKKDGNNDS